MRDCFIHIGTHKTGTTSLQATLWTRRGELQARHFVYPLAGHPPDYPGHHNIAWEITGDRRFRPEYGTLEDLIAEIGNREEAVVLSSEGFECAVHHPEAFKTFIRRLQLCDLRVKIIVYFRNQIDYSHSLYLTMLSYGILESFDEFLQKILRDQQFSWQELTFAFCYETFLKRLEAVDGLELVVRSYDRPRGGSLLDDFFSVLGLDVDELDVVRDILPIGLTPKHTAGGRPRTRSVTRSWKARKPRSWPETPATV